MNNNEWITDRLPSWGDTDRGYVWQSKDDGHVWPVWYTCVNEGGVWMPLKFPDAYEKPKKYAVILLIDRYSVYEIQTRTVLAYAPTREAAERIAETYEEVLP